MRGFRGSGNRNMYRQTGTEGLPSTELSAVANSIQKYCFFFLNFLGDGSPPVVRRALNTHIIRYDATVHIKHTGVFNHTDAVASHCCDWGTQCCFVGCDKYVTSGYQNLQY